jgi:hypothetical protein
MSAIQEFSEKVIDYAERLSEMADAAQGKRRSGYGVARRVILPASGAALVALVRSDFFARQAREALKDAKTLASDLPDDLMAVVRQSAGDGGSKTTSSPSRSSARRSTTRAGSSGTTRSRKKSAPRKRRSASR